MPSDHNRHNLSEAILVPDRPLRNVGSGNFPLEFQGWKTHELMAELRCLSVDFEVKGKVQGVFFRKFTKQEADKLKLNGWVENQADKNTVKGTIIGPEKSISAMKLWLKTKGSPKSKIASATFTNEQAVKDFKYTEFDIKR